MMSLIQLISMAALFVVCYCSLLQTSLARGSRQDEQEAERLANIELHEANKVRETAHQFSPVLLRVALSPDSEENRALKGPAHFLLRFFPDHKVGDIPFEYIPIEDKLYIRMPRYEAEFRSAMLRSMGSAYEDISRAWKDLGFTPPSGFVYVWIFSEVGQMKEEFAQYYGLDKTTRAFAVPCRFLIVPYASIPYSQYREWQEDAKSRGADPSAIRKRLDEFLEKDFKTSFAHELAHVYVNSTVGLRVSQEFDKWFHEAIAIWMSKDTQELLPAEYKDYEYLFDFLRMKYGNERFLTFVKQSIMDKSVDRSLQSTFGIGSQSDLRRAATTWRARNKAALLTTVLLVVGFLMAGFARLMNNKTVLWVVPVSVSIVSLYVWSLGVLNLETDSISQSKALNYLAIGLIFWAPAWKAWRVHNFRTLQKELRKVENWIRIGVANEASFYSSSEFKTAQDQLTEARVFGSKHRFRRGISRAREAAKMAESSVADIPDNKRRIRAHLERSFQELRHEILNLEGRLELARTTLHSSTVDIDHFLLSQFDWQLDSSNQKSRQIQLALEAGNLAKAKKRIKNLRGDVHRLDRSVTLFLLD